MCFLNSVVFSFSELHKVKDLRHYFEKVSGDMDSVLHRASGVSRTRTQDVNDINNLVIATRRAFRHTAVDYVHAMSIAQGKKRHEVVGAVSHYFDCILAERIIISYLRCSVVRMQ